jgi:hypothetical protein
MASEWVASQDGLGTTSTGIVHCARCDPHLLYMLLEGNGGHDEYFVRR